MSRISEGTYRLTIKCPDGNNFPSKFIITIVNSRIKNRICNFGYQCKNKVVFIETIFQVICDVFENATINEISNHPTIGYKLSMIIINKNSGNSYSIANMERIT
uniref:Uncharacterized protein n=1 Tax=viral metagenome TaxID=1070528 RepID=A0A6C0BCQ7_9ZZZZ